MAFADRMTAIARALEAAPARALTLAESLEHDLLAAGTTDPCELGWARDYKIRCLYRLGRDREGLAALTTPPARPMVLGARNAAWLHSVGAEMAARSGDAARARLLIGRALDLRQQAGDTRGVQLAVGTGLELLRRAPEHLEAWFDAVAARAQAAPAGSAEATALADALAEAARADWYPGALPSAARRRAELALHTAAGHGDTDELARLLADGVDPDARHPGYPGLPTAAIAAAFTGRAAAVQTLIDAGADLSLANLQGRTALHLAADQDHALVVAALCAAGAPLAALDFHGHTALHLAAWQDHRDSVRALVAARAPLAARDINGDTPLALAASEPVPEVVRILLAAGADLEATNDLGQTPLLRAAMTGRADVVDVLLTAGADPSHRDRGGRTALAWARAEGHTAAAARLRRR